ncbi:hypothetical protein LINPERHAP1_LOCUS8159 [Linum perenne]
MKFELDSLIYTALFSRRNPKYRRSPCSPPSSLLFRIEEYFICLEDVDSGCLT